MIKLLEKIKKGCKDLLSKRKISLSIVKNNVETTYPLDDKLYDICCWGEFDEMVLYDKEKLTEDVIEFAIQYMEWKIQEIETWEGEEDNQDDETQRRFNNRKDGINQCIVYLKNVIQEGSCNFILK